MGLMKPPMRPQSSKPGADSRRLGNAGGAARRAGGGRLSNQKSGTIEQKYSLQKTSSVHSLQSRKANSLSKDGKSVRGYNNVLLNSIDSSTG